MASVDELELLSRLRAGELPADEAAALRAQVAGRVDLQQALARLERLDALAQALGGGTQAASPDTRAGDEALVAAVLGRAQGRRGAMAWAAAAVLLAGIVAAALWPAGSGDAQVPLPEPRATAPVPTPVPTPVDDLPPYPHNVPGLFVGPLAKGRALWTPETKLQRPSDDAVLLREGTLVISGRARVEAPSGVVEIDGEALVSTEPENALPHVIRSLRSHPGQEGIDMRKRFEAFKGTVLAPAGAALLVLVTTGEVQATPRGGQPQKLKAGARWSPGAPVQKTAAQEGSPQKAPVGPAVVSAGEVSLEGVHAAVLSRTTQLSDCFSAALRHSPTLEGDVTLVLTLEAKGAHGVLREATVGEDYSLENPLVTSCLLQVLDGAKWPAPGAGEATVRYPIRLLPRGPESAPGVTLWLPEGVTGPEDRPARMAFTDREGRLLVRGTGHRLGPDTAPVKVVVFSDFECSFCLKGFRAAQELRGRYGDRIQLEFRHKPLPSHPHGRTSAAAAIAAEQQGRFWEFVARLVDHPGQRMREGMEAHAAALGLDLLRFRADMDSEGTQARIDQDIAEGDRLGARGIPTFFINGREVVGARPVEGYARIIDEELARATGR
jgi:predicted DsbA family dithiol-disulfide isomerase